MAEPIRVLVPSGGSHVAAMADHVRALQDAGRYVLFITTDRPYAVLERAFGQAGVDLERIHFLDTVSHLDGSAPIDRPDNAHFLASPTMLEMVAMRAEQLANRLGDGVHVVLDSLNTLALYNGISPVQEFAHYLANRLRTYGLPGDFVARQNREGAELQEKVAGFTDGRIVLDAPESGSKEVSS